MNKRKTRTGGHFPSLYLLFLWTILLLCLNSSLTAADAPQRTNPDLELSALAATTDPAIYTFFSVTFSLQNQGSTIVDNVVLAIPQPDGVVLQGSNPYTASQGIYQPWVPYHWTVGSLAPGAIATITLNYFNLSENPKTVYGQVIAQLPTDADSTPNNGTPPSPNEDDEAAVAINGGGNVFPDLAIANLNAPSTVKWGQSIDLEITISNQGHAPTDQNSVYFYLSADENLSTDDRFTTTVTIDNLAPGQSQTITDILLRIPISIGTESFFIIASVDPFDDLIESDEQNNQRAVPLALSFFEVPPDCSSWSSFETNVLCAEENAVGNYEAFLLTPSGNFEFVNRAELNEQGELLNIGFVNTLRTDSVVVVGNQVIKKNEFGNIIWQRTIPSAVFTDYPTITAAAELNDGSVVLGGIEKTIFPSLPPFDVDSLYLVKLSPDMVFQQAQVVFKKDFGLPTFVQGDVLHQLVARPDGGVDVLYTRANPFGLLPGNLNFTIEGYSADLVQLDIYLDLKDVFPERIIQTPCGEYRIEGPEFFFSDQGSYRGQTKVWLDLPSRHINQRLIARSGSVDIFGPYNSYQFVANTELPFSLGTIFNQSTLEEMELTFDPQGTPVTANLPFFPFEYAVHAEGSEVLIFYEDNNGSLRSTTAACVADPVCTDDLFAPTFVNCPGNFVIETEQMNAPLVFPNGLPIATDDCDEDLTYHFSHPEGSLLAEGNTTVTITATDDAGNTGTCTFVVQVILIVPSCTVNLLSNPDFEEVNPPFLFWTSIPDAIEVSNDAVSGNQAALLKGFAPLRLLQSVPAQPGVAYAFKVQAKLESDLLVDAQIQIKFLDNNFQPLGFSRVTRITGSEYEQYTIKWVAPENTARVEVSMVKDEGYGFFWVDDACLTAGPDPGPCNPATTPPIVFNCPEDIELFTTESEVQAFWSFSFV
ncbi:MAG: CARDB domain-containing protein, partial [Bacteroidota bacterium]